MIFIYRKVPSLLREKECYMFHENLKVWKLKHITPPIETAYLKKTWTKNIQSNDSLYFCLKLYWFV